MTERSDAIDGSIPVGKNSEVTVAKTVKPMAVIAAQGKRSVDGTALLTVSTLSPADDAVDAGTTGVHCAKRSQNCDEVDQFLHRGSGDGG